LGEVLGPKIVGKESPGGRCVTLDNQLANKKMLGASSSSKVNIQAIFEFLQCKYRSGRTFLTMSCQVGVCLPPDKPNGRCLLNYPLLVLGLRNTGLILAYAA